MSLVSEISLPENTTMKVNCILVSQTLSEFFFNSFINTVFSALIFLFRMCRAENKILFCFYAYTSHLFK